MKRSIMMLMAGIAVLGSASAAAAQGRDAAERGRRLEVDELRNDAAQERLKKPQDTGLLPPPQQSQPGATRKSKRSKQRN